MKIYLAILGVSLIAHTAFSGSLVGVGLLLAQPETNGQVKVMQIVPDSPASEAGIKVGCWLISVDGTPTRGMTLSNCVYRIRGVPGTEVVLGVVDPKLHRTNEVTLKRAAIHFKAPPVHPSKVLPSTNNDP